MAAPRKVFVIGVGMTKFEKPGRRENFDYPDMALEAGTKALKDAGISYDKIEQACIGYVYGDSTCGQRALYQLGLTGIPMYNVNNNCSTGSTALMMAKQLVEGGLTECVMALGFEKMERGSLSAKFTDRTQPMDKHVLTMLDVEELTSGPMAAQMFGNAGRAHMQQYDRTQPLDKHVYTMLEKEELTAAPINPQMFGNAGREHMRKYGTKPEHFAKIAHKNHKHSTNNPYSQFQDEYSLEQIQKSPMIHEPLTKLQCCPTSDGAGCAILASEDFVVRHRLQGQAVEIVAQTMATDLPSTFTEKNCMKIVGYDMTKKAATDAFRKAGITPQDVQVVELHDCFSANELISYEALGLCPEGKAGEFIDRGDNTYGGRVVVNPSGGLISKGHPLGATGLAQCSELCWQLRGLAGKRQVNNVRYALQHNIGLGGAVVVTIYKLGWPQLANKSVSAGVQMSATSAQRSDYKAAAIFDQIEEQLKQNGEDYVKKVKGIFCFKVKKGSDTGVFVVDVKNGKGSVKFDPNGKGDVTISATDDDLLNLLNGKLNPQQAFFQGKLKIAGNMGLAMKLKELQPNTKAKL